MSETAQGLPEAGGPLLLKTLDTIFEAAIVGVYEEEEGASLLRDLGLVALHGSEGGDEDVDVLVIANWNTLDTFAIQRAERGADISNELPFPVRFQVQQQDMLKREMPAGIVIGGKDQSAHTLRSAITSDGVIVPWLTCLDEEGSEVMVWPGINTCKENLRSNVGILLAALEASVFVDLYRESAGSDPLEIAFMNS